MYIDTVSNLVELIRINNVTLCNIRGTFVKCWLFATHCQFIAYMTKVTDLSEVHSNGSFILLTSKMLIQLAKMLEFDLQMYASISCQCTSNIVVK